MEIFQCTSIALVSQGHKSFDHNENNFIYSKAIWLTRKLTKKGKLQLNIVIAQIFSYKLGVLEIFSFIFHFPFFSLCIDHYSNIALKLLVILMAIGDNRHILRGIISLFRI